MKDVYEAATISKQAVHQHRMRALQKGQTVAALLKKANQIRMEHPKGGCRKMALELRVKGCGRDKTEQLLLENGYRVYYRRRYKRTTYAQHGLYYPDIIEGLELNDINQVVQTDITYYDVNGRFYYIVFLIDVYSRRIVGYAVNKTMEAEGNIQALKMLFATRSNCCLEGLIHHSDRGGQFIDMLYNTLLRHAGIKMSMCKNAWQNAYGERINKTIKEEYLDGWCIESFEQLRSAVTRAVNHYNKKRKHDSLQKKTPLAFEGEVEKMAKEERPIMKLYKDLRGLST
jgi:transposase InsO family protein